MKNIIVLIFLVIATSCNQNAEEKSNSKIESESANSNPISIEEIKTGYNPNGTNYNGTPLWAPCIAIKFKNNSNNDYTEGNFVKGIFIRKDTNEQVGEMEVTLSTPDKPIVGGTIKKIKLQPNYGFLVLTDVEVVVRVYINSQLIDEYKIDNKEFDADWY